MTSIVFPGQGSQFTGMVKDFFDNYDTAKQTILEVEDCVSLNLRNIIFENKDNLLDITKYTQICIFAASMAIFKTLQNQTNLNLNNISCMLGHSLGEYSALTASGKIDIREASKILFKRGDLMNNSIKPGHTGMAALIGLPIEKIEKIITEQNINLEIANDNSPIQVVISGLINEIKESKKIFLENGVRKFVELQVSAAFHSKFMKNAQDELSDYISKLNFNSTEINIISNFDGKITNNNEILKKNLINQMASRVRWKESISNLEVSGEKNIIEIGPNKVLSGLIKRISNNFDIISITNILDLEKFK